MGATASSEDADESKPAPDVFENLLKKLKISAAEAVAIGDTRYDAIAAGKAGIATIGVSVVGVRKIRCGRPDVSRCFPGLRLFANFDHCLVTTKYA